ncbi:hypothetical protein [Bradyrhizobium sp. STM 3557]|uniref:8-oxoguanine DNA glycosylase OGG fold protein n=1 Tax=Bradyrhizobium sp. STM 3557 TaxID=578920 RepID=UPI00388D6C78
MVAVDGWFCAVVDFSADGAGAGRVNRSLTEIAMDATQSRPLYFCEPHFSLFLESKPGKWRSKEVGKWSTATGHRLRGTYSPANLDRPLQRTDLVSLRDSEDAEVLDVCVFIFAWGGMKTPDGQALLNSGNREWVCVSELIRDGRVCYLEGYERFFRLSKAGKLPGCGPAYYTKLLFFLPKSGLRRGVIMDQWTARSINLLTGMDLVSIRGSGRRGWVLPSNDARVYENFCNAVGSLAAQTDCSIEETEKRLFSEGGRVPANWRKHVIACT